MPDEALSPDGWLSLGIPGAALFLVLVVIVLMFRQQNKSVDKLCSKIDDLVSSFSENNLELNKMIISNDRDQKELLRILTEINLLLNDTHKRVIRIDTRTYHEYTEKGSSKNGSTRTFGSDPDC